MSKAKKETFKKDRALRFYSEVLGLERLHYGLWEDGDPRNIEGAKIAQERYEDFLIKETEALFPNTSQTSILDVGCGTGIMTERLYKKGYNVEGLSPDLYQKEIFEKRVPVKFHLARFQNFIPQKKYDLIIMSESSQYIPIALLFQKVRECLKPGGYLMVCDYFRLDSGTDIMGKSGHKIGLFRESAANNGFENTKELDITLKTIPTLEAAKIFTERYILPSLDIAREKIEEKYPRIYKLLKWLLRKKIEKASKNLILIDPVEFVKNKCYMYFIFRAQ